MGESHHQPSSRFGLQSAGGEIVEVQGGHIVRSTGRKDRHSKVCTAKGPRDRRVRLSAPTAIQFYDVQDRLGYDRPSKAVDWLIKKAKPAIDELAELPAWHPTATTTTTTSASPADAALPVKQGHEQSRLHLRNQIDAVVGSSERTMAAETAPSSYAFQQQQSLNNPSHSSSFLPPSMDSDSIADTIKSFFPIAAAAAAATTSASSMHFHSYQPDLLSSTSGQAQDLRLSLQSFQDPILLHHQPQPQPHHHPTPSPSAEQALLCGSAPLSFDATSGSWSQQRPAPETGRFQRMVAWNSGTDEGGGGGGFVYHFPPPPLQPLFGQSPFFSQRGPLQSSYSPSIRGWTDQQIAAAEHHQTAAAYPPSSGIGFASGGFSGFRIPARIQGEEEHDAVSNKPSSASRR